MVAFLNLAGCYDEEQIIDPVITDFDFSTPSIENVYPADGATNVNRKGELGVKFDRAMDTASVNAGLRVAGGSAMLAWMDSLMHGQDSASGMGGGNMGNPPDDKMMNWIDSVGYTGEIHWNAAMDSCAFDPDSILLPNASHVILLTGDIRAAEGSTLDMDGFEYSSYMSFFTTGP